MVFSGSSLNTIKQTSRQTIKEIILIHVLISFSSCFKYKCPCTCRVRCLTPSAINNISVISWQSVTEKKPSTCCKSLTNFITQCCIEHTSPWSQFELTTLVVIGTDCTCTVNCNSNYHTIMATTAFKCRWISIHHYMYIVRKESFPNIHVYSTNVLELSIPEKVILETCCAHLHFYYKMISKYLSQTYDFLLLGCMSRQL